MKKTLLLAYKQLKRNKARASMTVFGVTIGIAVVIIVLSAGNGVKGLVMGELESFGDDWINIEVRVPSAGTAGSAQGMAQGVTITTMTLEDAEAIERLDNIKNIYAGVTTQAVVSHGNQKDQPTFFAVTPSYIDIDAGTTIADGRFFTAGEDDSAASVIVLGWDLKNTLFGNTEAVGQRVKVGNRSFRVIGVVEERGATGFFNYDELAYIPLQTAQKRIMGIDHILFMIAQMHDSSLSATTAEEIRWLLREQHDIDDPDKDDFAVTTQEESMEIIDTVFIGIQTLLVVLAMISLIVGGVGIMNVMYVSVVERTFEIGLRKSVGAREEDIRRQFLIEAIVMTTIGGLIGIVLGIIVSYGVAIGARQFGLDWDFIISVPSVILGTSFSVIVGLLFGYFPAKHAASLDPIEALRAE